MKFKINGMEWKIIEAPRNDVMLMLDGTIRAGICYKDLCEIYLYEGLKKDVKKRVLFHELGHAFYSSYGFDNVEKFNEETICNFIMCYAEEITRIGQAYFKKDKKE